MSDADFEAVKKLQAERNAAAAAKKGSKTFDPSNQRTDVSTKASLTESFDTELYDRNGGDRFSGYNTSIAVDGDDDEADPSGGDGSRRLVGQYTATNAQMNEFAHGGGVEEEDFMQGRERQATIASRQTEYERKGRLARGPLTPTRADPFAANRQAGVEDQGQTYRELMAARDLEREERVKKIIAEKHANGEVGVVEHQATLRHEDSSDKENKEAGSTVTVASGRKRKAHLLPTSPTQKPNDLDGIRHQRQERWPSMLLLDAHGGIKRRLL